MRVGELEALRLADLDEPGGRLGVSAAMSKTRRARVVAVPVDLYRRRWSSPRSRSVSSIARYWPRRSGSWCLAGPAVGQVWLGW
jgi:integrase